LYQVFHEQSFFFGPQFIKLMLFSEGVGPIPKWAIKATRSIGTMFSSTTFDATFKATTFSTTFDVSFNQAHNFSSSLVLQS
jgi:hypothetical protein